MRFLSSRLSRILLRFPLSLTLGMAALGAAIARLAWAGEVEFTGPGFSVLSWLLLIGSVVAAERLVGTRWALSTAAAATAGGVVLAWVLLSAGAALGEPMSEEALTYQPWTPSVTSAALLMAVSGHLRPASRRTLRWIVVTAVAALLLTTGHASDVSRAIAAGLGFLAGTVGHGTVPVAGWRPSAQARWRSTLSSVLLVVASALALVAVAPNATGPLVWPCIAVDPVVAPVAAVLLLVSAVLVWRGRALGVILGASVLAAVAVVALTELVVLPALDGTLGWSDLSTEEADWQFIILLSAAVPAVATLVFALGAQAVLRRRAPLPTEADRERLRSVLRSAGDGTFAHMATWRGNSYWFGEDGSAVAYRVRDGVAFTVGDPITKNPAAAVRAFAAFCNSGGWTPAFYSVHDDAAAALQTAGWARMPVGTDSVIDVPDFTLSGRSRQDLRTAVNRAGREGLSASWTSYADVAPHLRAQIETLCAGWVDGRQLPEMGFTLGGLNELIDPEVRLMLAVDAEDRVHVVTSWLPRYRDGVLVGWTLDVMRRDPKAMPGAMEFTIVSTIQHAAADGLPIVSLSGTPLAAHDGDTCGAFTLRMKKVFEPAYGFASLERFKAKFGARHESLWMCYPQPMQLSVIAPALLRTYMPSLRLTSAIRAVRTLA
jgi:lysylphosphatidylglycerol synthetase-like protein (DUF2156 family)